MIVPMSKVVRMSVRAESIGHAVESTGSMHNRRLLLAVAILLWFEAWIGTAVAVQKKLPFGLGGHGHPNDVWGDFVSGGGTALSPPLMILVIYAALIVLATRRGWFGTIGVGGLGLLGLLSLGTIVGEPLARRVLSPSHIVFPETALVMVSLIGATLMFLLAVWNLMSFFAREP